MPLYHIFLRIFINFFSVFFFFFFHVPAPPAIYTLSLHDALPIFGQQMVEKLESILAAEQIPKSPHPIVGGS